MPGQDALYHRLFSHPLMVETLVREFVPEAMAANLDFSRMERVNAKTHGEALDGGIHRREGDVIWRLPTHGGLDLYLYLLLEFQSGVDWWMAVRTQVYEGLLWQQVIAERKLGRGDRLPPVLLIVLYNGEARWAAPVDTASLIALPAGSPLWPWQPRIRYHVLDMGAVAADLPAERDSVAALLFRLEQRQPPEALAELIDEVVGWFRRHSGHEELRRLFTELVYQAIAGLGVSVPIPDDLMEMQTMLATLGESWKQQWKAEGRLEGRLEGRAEGQAKALVLLVEQRFGPLPAALRGRIETADAATIEAWLGRLMDATSLEMLLASSN
jgi:Putative transposase, YhgA-like